ncbi:hypothetical protein SAMN05720354_11729 [Nitrosospira sp. Nsp1]|nr:hypothetical protein SAMN05720354_11729 [Nitrosospira sp. Nsp1]
MANNSFKPNSGSSLVCGPCIGSLVATVFPGLTGELQTELESFRLMGG